MLDEPTRGVAHNAFNTYISSVQQLVHITNVLPETTAASRSVPEKGNVELLRRSLASLSEDVNKNSSRVMQILNMYLRHLEVQSESYGILSIVVDEKVKRCLRSPVFGGLSGYRLLGDRSL